MKTLEIADNTSICGRCYKPSNDDFDTVFDEFDDPYHRKCLELELQAQKSGIYQCGSCERVFSKLLDGECPYCGSGNWVQGYIDD